MFDPSIYDTDNGLEGSGISGGKYSVNKFVRDFNKIGKLVKPVAKPIFKALTDKAVGKIIGAGDYSDDCDDYEGSGISGGKYSVNKFVKDFNKIGKLVKPVAKPIIKALTNKAVGKIIGSGELYPPTVAKGGRRGSSARGELIKKVMREHGLNLGQASKHIKENGLY